jgi:2-methylcitrate dehydratase
MSHDIRSAERPPFDTILQAMADYVMDYDAGQSALAMETARYNLMDSLACALLALDYPECVKLLGPVVPGATLVNGTRVPGTSHELDPVKAAWDIGCLVRYLDFNDTWLAAEWGHPSDNLGAILGIADWLSRKNIAEGKAPLLVRDVLKAMILAHEIQGVTALENAFNRVGLDHVMLVRIASAAVAAKMLGGTREDVLNTLSHAWIDGCSLRTYRHAPNAGPRKSWAAGDASSRGVRLALICLSGEIGYPSALTAKTWGFQDSLYRGNELKFSRPFGSYTMENILFKLSFPAEFHAQSAVECAMTLHPQVKDRLDQIARIEIETQEAGCRIIDKTGPLNNYADRDHCIQYMVAVPLIKGSLTAEDYTDAAAADPRIDALRNLTTVKENPRFSQEYLEADKRYIGNSVQVFFKDGSHTEKITVDAPIGHRLRRAEGIPVLIDKFERAIAGKLSARRCAAINTLCADQARFEATPVQDFMGLFAR